MAGTEELLSRLAALEDGYYGDKEAARQKAFFDTYGERFSNNRGLGLAILNELDARGIDTTAADEAVSQILDQLRTECNEIINSIKVVQEQAIQNAQKVEQVANVVSEAATANPKADASAIMPPPDMPPMPPADVPPADVPPVGPESEVPPEPPADVPPAGPDSEVPPEPPAEEPMPQAAVSDARMKNIRTVLSDVRAKRIKASANNTQPKKETNCFKPSAGMLEAASRGF